MHPALVLASQSPARASLLERAHIPYRAVVSHVDEAAVGADEIIVLDKGVIVERGDHATLLEQDGVYASMWSRQREADAALEVLQRADAPVVPVRGRGSVPETAAAE